MSGYMQRPTSNSSSNNLRFVLQLAYGGVQSAHTAAVAAACAEQGLTSHLLLRGECPAVPAGNLLISRMFGSVTHVSRAEYADRQRMVQHHLERVAASLPTGNKVNI